MPIIYGLWVLVVIGALFEYGKGGVIAAANWAIVGVVMVGVIHVIAFIVRKPNNKKPENNDQNHHSTQSASLKNEADDSINQRLHEEHLYAEVAEEISSGNVRAGLMAKALAEADGDLNKQRALYIKYRMQSLKDESELARLAELREQAAKNLAEAELEEEKRKQQRIKDIDDYFGGN